MQKSLKDIFAGVPNIDERSAAFLVAALEKNNLAGFDYLEFKQSLEALAQFIPDEMTVYKSAYTTASTMGLTKDKLLKTAGHYKNVLAKERSQFDKALQQQVQRQIAGKQKEAQSLTLAVQQKKEQIERLRKEIEKHQEKIDAVDGLIEQAKDKIETTKNNFEATYSTIATEIDDDINKIQQYL